MDLYPLLPVSDGVIALRPLAYADADAYAAGSLDPAVRDYGHLPLAQYTPAIVREQIDTVIDEGLRTGNLAVLAIADATDDRFLGSAVVFDIQGEAAEIGYWLAPAARGRGAAARAVTLLGGLARAIGIATLVARTEVENGASRRVLTAAGFELRDESVRQQAPSGDDVELSVYVRSA